MSFGFLRAITILGLVFSAGLALPQSAMSESITVGAFKDNSLFGSPTLSNGAGEFLFSGRTGNPGGGSSVEKNRRALLAFDLAGIPAGAVIDSATLTLKVSRTPPGLFPHSFALHRLTSDWGEGNSNAGSPGGRGAQAQTNDATWVHTFFPAQGWSTEGGDFVAAASDTQILEENGFYSWSSTQLAADVQAWVDSPESNFGWIIIGNESIQNTARRFDSRESLNPANRPALSIEFTLPDSRIPGDADNDDDVDRADLLIVANNFGTQTGEGFDAGDFDDSGTVDLLDLAILKRSFGQTTSSPSAAAVPEPTTLFLSSCGLMAMFGRRTGVRRRS